MQKNKPEKKEISIDELQLTEHTLQNLSLQKQVFNLELLETRNALEELDKTENNEVYKLVGSVLVRANKEELKKELKRKVELLELRIKAIEKQEQELKEKLLKDRDTLLKSKIEKK